MKRRNNFIAALMFCGVAALAGSVIPNAKTNSGRTHSVEDSSKVQNPIVPENSIVDEVVWVVGDEPILKSDIEAMRMQMLAENVRWEGDPDCSIPEQLAVQKLFLHQAELDSVEVTESEIMSGIDQQLNQWIKILGSQEKLEEYRKKSLSEIRSEMHDDFKNQQLIQKMQHKLVQEIKVSPADVRRYFKDLPEDSIPFVPTEVEVQILTRQPKIKQEEINRVKDLLRGYTERINNGETTFSTLARLYSEDPVSARQGGEMDYVGRGFLDPSFANVAFNLTDPNKVSKIVETEFGFHIIQLIDKRGDKIKCRHILIKPKVAGDEIDSAMVQIDSLRQDIISEKITFDDAASYLSDDKDTRNNKGLMSNLTENGMTSRFQMKDLPTELARAVETMNPGDISEPFQMVNSKGKTVVLIAKLKSRTQGHKATITEDFQVMKDIVLAKEREKAIHDWVTNKIKQTYIQMSDRYKGCDFKYQGWVK